jgi:peptidoglycan/xylan/chitin deacetylase (PgdA/CDA1 family)
MHPVHRGVGRSLVRARLTHGRFADRAGLTVLGWHRLGSRTDGLTTPVSAFRQQMEQLRELDANVLPLSQATRLLLEGNLPPRAVCITFDDGYASIAERAWPILKDYGFPATLFVVSGYLATNEVFPWDEPSPDLRLMTAADVQDIHRDGMEIGSHTVRHSWLPAGSDAQVLQDLISSRLDLEELLQTPILGFAYPMGGWDRRVRRLAMAAGYTHAITVDRGCNVGERVHPFSLRRSFVSANMKDFGLLLDGGFDHLRVLDRMRSRISARGRAFDVA